jgi:isocitrate lyase
MFVIRALTAARFLTNVLRVRESMVLRTGKERANLLLYVLL